MDAPRLQTSADLILDLAASRHLLESEVLPRYIVGRRWFGGKAREPRTFEIVEWVPFPREVPPEASVLALVRVGYADGSAETYTLPLSVIPVSAMEETIIAHLEGGFVLTEAIQRGAFRATLMRLIARRESLAGLHGSLVGVPGTALQPAADEFASRVLAVEQSNSSLIYTDGSGADRLFVKLFRKLEEGMNPDVEITRQLSDIQHFAHVPPFGGSLEYRQQGAAEPQVIALALGMVPNDGDAWAFTLREVAAYYSSIRDHRAAAPDFPVPAFSGDGKAPELMQGLLGTYLSRARQLGVRTGELHLALGAETPEPGFESESLTRKDLEELAAEIRNSARRARTLLSASSARELLPADLKGQLRTMDEEIERRADLLEKSSIQTTKIRTHGDYHLGQVLNTGTDFVIIDFEGEPLRPLAERKEKRSPLRDVAGMLRSFHYAAHSGLTGAQDSEALLPWAEAWSRVVGHTFVCGWREAVGSAPFVPADRRQFQSLLDAFLLEKALYEVAYELNNRPTWLAIPLRGIRAVLGDGTAD